MKRPSRVLLAILVLGAAFFVVARFSDGPFGIVSGGPLSSGEWKASEGVDFGFVKDMDTLELQLIDPPRSRTTWLIFHEGSLYIPAGYMDLPVWKQWPREAVQNGRSVVRIEGIRYPFFLERVKDRKTWQRVTQLVAKKYGMGQEEADEEPGPEVWNQTWIFRLNPQGLENS